MRTALDLARDPATASRARPTAATGSGRRFVAIGDPQAPLEKFLRILDRHGLLAEDGMLAQEVSLVSVGDHFDYPTSGGDLPGVAEDGFRLLRWLALHPPAQAILIAGNHDLSRVMEFWRISDEEFGLAREFARAILSEDSPASSVLRREFRVRFPDVPTPEVAERDYASFTEEQRDLVQSLLRGGRFRLAWAGLLRHGEQPEREVLLTHASVTLRDLRLLRAPDERGPARIARKLNELLGSAVEAAAGRWSRGEKSPLDLGPLHLPGGLAAGLGRGAGREGGGLLYQRPADPERADASGKREFEEPGPRRYDPRRLPLGLLQGAGHFGHRKCLLDLDRWAAPSAREVPVGGMRTLRTDGRQVLYEMEIRPVPESNAGLYMIDAEMYRSAEADYPVLDFMGWVEGLT